ncbi:unnamed protein product [Effrenium voratum]|nr:unnamed protein product [Effrenium voratum]
MVRTRWQQALCSCIYDWTRVTNDGLVVGRGQAEAETLETVPTASVLTRWDPLRGLEREEFVSHCINYSLQERVRRSLKWLSDEDLGYVGGHHFGDQAQQLERLQARASAQAADAPLEAAMLPDDWWFLADLCLLLSIAGLVAVLPLISSAPISDISAKPGSNWVVVTTARPHGVGFRPGVQRVLQRLFGSPKIRLWGTGCPLEGKNAWQVDDVLNASQLRIFANGMGIGESSKGFCRLVFPASLIWTSILGVPVLVAIVFQLLLITLLGSLGAFRLVLVAPAVLLGLSGYWCQWLQTRNALDEQIRFYRRLMGPSPCERGAMRAISGGQLCEFHRVFQTFIGRRNMYYVVNNIVTPVTRPWNLSLAELMGSGTLDYYVSFLWINAFEDLVASIRRHYQTSDLSNRYWIDVFALNQQNIQAEIGDGHLWDSSFFHAMRSSSCKGGFVVFADVESLGAVFTRSWCIFEVYTMIQDNQRSGPYEGLLFRTPCGSLSECSFDFAMDCVRRLRSIDLREATAASQQDVAMIENYISELGGWDFIWNLIMESVTEAAMSLEAQAIDAAVVLKVDTLLRDFAATLSPPCASSPGPQRALGAGQLSVLREFFGSVLDGRDMYWICDRIVKPLTREKRLSYAELVGCGELNWFISHWWGMHFNKTVDSVVKHATSSASSWESVRYWICTFSNNQWAMDEEIPPGAPPSESSFYKALRSRSCQGTCMILDGSVVPLTRAWCLFELLQTFTIQDETAPREGLAILTSSGVLNSGRCSIDTAMAIGQELTTLRLENAQASKEEDKQLIFGAVQAAGGFDAINSKLRQKIREVLGTVASQWNRDINRLQIQLGSDRFAFSHCGFGP